ncbi:hypothetical protein [Streptomyces coffeae]|uniref:Uncharacterized protein n=1 Tax=Streptomyces coffeae TaxID=621382 RepID=A0ABS1NKE3_9ACTN|nr:hypothetical protein [Streptomyces coffeae]MBL1100538.1 hypothetical protein [Streptomyces coffeae]
MDTPASPETLMWEARAHPGSQSALLTWVEEIAVPALLADPACLDVSTYLGGQDRVVVITHSTGYPPRLPEPPEDLLLRSAHQWPFHLHARHTTPHTPRDPGVTGV